MTNRPVSLRNFIVAEGFWKDRMELVRTEVIPYQWDILNDRVTDANPSYCMRNFRIAGKLLKEQREMGASFQEPVYTFRGFEALPDDPGLLEDKFYGFVFQDSDFVKWIEAVSYSLINHPDSELEKVADEAIETVCAAQHENGYLDTYYIINGMDGIFTNLRDHHELYCFGHLTEGAIAYYQATGKRKLLDAAIKFADFIEARFGEEKGKCKGYPGHEIAEMALVRLYEVTRETRYLNLARFFINERGKRPYYWDSEKHSEKRETREKYEYYQAHRPVREQEEAVGHAVRAMYLYCGMTDIARLTDDEKLWKACRRLWDSAVKEKMYITGGIGGTSIGEAFSFPFDLPNELAYAETCASIGLIFWARRMLEKEVKAEYGDVMERALYNTVLAGMALDGKSFFYVNPLEVFPEACRSDARKGHVKTVRQKWFGCACCPPNLARMISSLPSYAFTESENCIYMHLHISGELVKVVNGTRAVFQIDSGFPYNGRVKIRHIGKKPVNMKFAVRIPGWNNEKEIQISVKFSVCEQNGYCYIEGIWTEGDEVIFDFTMIPRYYQADSRVRDDIGKIAIQKGPLVYCAEEVDNEKGLYLYEIYPNEVPSDRKVRMEEQEIPALAVKARKRVIKRRKQELYHKYEPAKYEEKEMIMIPYFAWANRGENEMSVWFDQV